MPKRFFENNFWTMKASGRVEPYTWWPYKGQVNIWPQVKVTWDQMLTQVGHVAYQSMRRDNTSTEYKNTFLVIFLYVQEIFL